MVEEGGEAPDFRAEDRRRRARQAVPVPRPSGRPLLLPARRHPGCTAQACGIRDSYDEFGERGAVVLGVSPDDESSHVKFKEKYGLPFTLLADPDHEVAELYGVWKEKTYGGKKYWGVERSTTSSTRTDGSRRRCFGSRPDTHAEKVLAALALLMEGMAEAPRYLRPAQRSGNAEIVASGPARTGEQESLGGGRPHPRAPRRPLLAIRGIFADADEDTRSSPNRPTRPCE